MRYSYSSMEFPAIICGSRYRLDTETEGGKREKNGKEIHLIEKFPEFSKKRKAFTQL